MKLIKENKNIIPALAKVSGIPEERLVKINGPHAISNWAHLGIYYAREEEGPTLAAAGDLFNRSFAGANLACIKVQKALQDPEFKDDIETNLKTLRNEITKLENQNQK